jgi:hypothetical protein
MSAVLELPLENQIIKIGHLVIESSPVVVKGNFPEALAMIKKDVADNILLVTPETTSTCKDQIAEFRKDARDLTASWKAHEKYLNKDVLDAAQHVKLICQVLTDGAEEMSAQVKKIEQETMDICTELLVRFRVACWDELGVETEYMKASIEDLIKLGSMTPKGDLTKGAKTEVETRCKLDKAQQERVASRLMALENLCLKADINPPLTRASIDHFLHTDDPVFYSKLDIVVLAEQSRKAEAERIMKERLEAENQRKLEEALKAQQAEANRIAMEAARKEASERQAEGIRRAQELKALEDAKNLNAAQVMEKRRQDEGNQNAAQALAVELSKFTSEPEYPGEQLVNPVDAEEIKARINHIREMDARYPEQENKDLIQELKKQLAGADKLVTFQVEVMVAYKFMFRSKMSTPHSKIKEHFKGKVVAMGVDASLIRDVYVEAAQ